MKILVTGAGGFLGSHFVDRLVAENHEVLALDPAGKKKFITNQARVYKLSCKSPSLNKIFEKEKPDMVCHFGTDDTVLTSFDHPLKNAEHIQNTLNLLELCKHHKVKRIIYPSSAATYGNPQYLPCDEQHPCHPVSPLGVTQRAIENYLYFYWVNFNLDHIILRIANAYGPRQSGERDGGIISILIRQMLRSEQVIINGDGFQERDFIYSSDVMDGIMAAVNYSARTGKRVPPAHFIFNLGTSRSYSINHLFGKLKEHIIYNRKPVKGPQLPCEVFEMSLDPAHAITKLNWSPKVNLDDGINRTLRWFKKELKIK